MQQRTCVIKARAYCESNNTTPDEIRSATVGQIQNALSLSAAEIVEHRRFWPGIQEMLMRDALDRQRQDRLILFKQRIEAAYPDATDLTSVTAIQLAEALLPYLYGEAA